MRKLALLALLPGIAMADPRFQPIPVENHAYSGGWEHFVGGGVAAFDCDADGFTDLFAAGGTDPAALFRNQGQDTVTFEKSTPDALALTGVTGAYPVDIDGDGWLDLAILRVGPNALMQGGPDCSFVPFDLGFHSPDRWTTAFSATWEGDGLPSLVFGNYVDRSNPNGPFEACDVNALYRPLSGRYVETTLSPGFCALSTLFSDWGRQGRVDLRFSNDRHYYVRDGVEQMWAMDSTPRLYTQADGWQQHSLWGMGIASRDITGDGLPEIYLSSMGDQRLQMLVPGTSGPHYADVPFDWGTTAHRPHLGDDGRPSTGWHIAFGDVQNDGLDDVFIAKGNVEQMPSNALEDPNSLLIAGPDGFEEGSIAAGIASMSRSRGVALTDLNNDGRVDLVVTNRRAPMEIYQNVTTDTGHWLEIKLQQAGPNRHAIGAWIELRIADRVQSRELTIGGGHAGGTLAWEHFGLGEAETAQLRIIWPDGATSQWRPLTADQHVTLTRDGVDFVTDPPQNR